MGHEKVIERGIELLTLCQQLQSERDGVDRPAPSSMDKSKSLDAFALDVVEAISYMTALYKLLPIQERLAAVGRELERQGKLKLNWGDDYSRAALDHLLANSKLDAVPSFPATDLWMNL